MASTGRSASRQSSNIAGGRSTVVMVEPITAMHTTDGTGGAMDVQPLLRLMDICTCASAEKHTRVNCVTASCGDIVFEHVPRCGELLELTATPVYAGRTSLDIGLTVMAEGDGGARRFVCYASFTYVTTRDKDGNKRLCPPLSACDDDGGGDEDGGGDDVPESVQWERTVGFYRRALVKAESKSSEKITRDLGDGCGFDREFTEVVLPAHLNHMQHTFGGIVMGWMCKAALAEASRKSKRSCGSLQILSVMRIEFASGSDVSNHLVFRPRLNAIFDDARSAEIEVRVSRRSIETGVETYMNTGYFYISEGGESDANKRPFTSSRDFISSARRDSLWGRVESDASWRRRLLLARRRLLGGLGEAVEWHPVLGEEAPLLTILAVLRIVHYNDALVKWTPLHHEGKGIRKSLRQYMMLEPRETDFLAEFTRYETVVDKSNTFILRAKGVLNGTVEALFRLIKDERPQWDEICTSIRPIEKKSTADADNEDGIGWDIVQHSAVMPAEVMLLSYLSCCFTGSLPKSRIPLCLLRVWKTVKDGDGDAILATQSVRHPDAAENSLTEVLPSGWFLSPLPDVNNLPSGVSVTYVAEHDLRYLRRLVPTFADEKIIDMIAKTTRHWFSTIESMAANTDANNYGSIA